MDSMPVLDSAKRKKLSKVYLDFGLRSWLLSREYFECDRIEMERRSERSRSRSFDLLFLRCLLL